MTLQFSRGCPYLCEFCDIIVMFGRKPRWKSPEQIGLELDELRKRNIRDAFFVDDNFIGNRKAAKTLLKYLKDYQERHGYRFIFGTEVSLNVAQDGELLRLFREANFAWVFIGIESPDVDSLKETKKSQNLQNDILDSVRKIYAHGIDVLAGFIIGFDNDTLETFERQYRFIIDSGIQAAMVGLLTALPRTPLYQRLEKEGRLIAQAESTNNTRLGTNIVPKRMQYDAMVASYQALYKRLLEDRQIADRIRNKARYLRDPVRQSQYGLIEGLAILRRLMARGILPGGWSRLFHFLRSLPLALAAPAAAGHHRLDHGTGHARLRRAALRCRDEIPASRRLEPVRILAGRAGRLPAKRQGHRGAEGRPRRRAEPVGLLQGMAGPGLLLARSQAPREAAQAHSFNRHASHRAGTRGGDSRI